MSNPGLDAINMEADDVLSVRRQGEIAELVNRLARFRPTKVMLESAYHSPVQQQRYEQYLAGKYQLSRNEIDQIGFRLAKQVGLSKVNPIDYPMWMSGETYDELDFNRIRRAAPSVPAKPRELTEEELLLRRSTVSDYLAYLNRPEQWFQGNHLRYYMDNFDDDPENVSIYDKVDMLTNWYKRNFRMFANVVRVMERPKDRGIIIVGSGHLAILRQLAQDMPGFCLVDPAGYLQGAKGG